MSCSRFLVVAGRAVTVTRFTARAHVGDLHMNDRNLTANFRRHELVFCKARAGVIIIGGGCRKQRDDRARRWLEIKALLARLNSR